MPKRNKRREDSDSLEASLRAKSSQDRDDTPYDAWMMRHVR